jgi:hypothetical protein
MARIISLLGNKRPALAFAVAAAAGFGLGASPPSPTTAECVVELFTSQGCSSCPPADRLAATMARDPANIVLSFPVDYWDYIGWKDTLASPTFSARQKAYAASRGDGRVYTPQVVVDGLTDAVGSDRDEIDRAIRANKGRGGAMTIPVHLIDKDGVLKVEIGAGPGGPAGIFLLRVAATRTVTIGRGENTGRSITYTNVVRAMNRLGDWDGSAKTFEVPELKGEGEGYVVLVQQGTQDKPGAILAGAKSSGL